MHRVTLKWLAVGACLLTIVLLFVYQTTSQFNQANHQSEQVDIDDSAAGVADNEPARAILTESSSDSVTFNLIAVSTQDGNAVIERANKTELVSVGDTFSGFDSSDKKNTKVMQVSDDRIVVRDLDTQGIYIVSLKGKAESSPIQKLSSDIKISRPLPHRPAAAKKESLLKPE